MEWLNSGTQILIAVISILGIVGTLVAWLFKLGYRVTTLEKRFDSHKSEAEEDRKILQTIQTDIAVIKNTICQGSKGD